MFYAKNLARINNKFYYYVFKIHYLPEKISVILIRVLAFIFFIFTILQLVR